jgi:hypothetical protein
VSTPNPTRPDPHHPHPRSLTPTHPQRPRPPAGPLAHAANIRLEPAPEPLR